MLREADSNPTPPETEQVSSDSSRKPNDANLAEAIEHFSNPEYAQYDKEVHHDEPKIEVVNASPTYNSGADTSPDSSGTSKRQKIVTGIAVVGAVLGGGAITGNNPAEIPVKAVTATAGAVESVGANVIEPVVSSAIDFVKSDSDPLANYTGADADKNIIAGEQDTANTDSGELPAPQPEAIYDGVHTYDADPGPQELPTAPPEPAVIEGIADNSQTASPAETGGAAPGEISGGSPAQP